MNAHGSLPASLQRFGLTPRVCATRSRFGFWMLASLLAGLPGVFLASSAFAQAFVAEITAADIGGMTPTGIAIDNQNTPSILYVADGPAGRILKFDASTGARLAVLGRPGSGDGEFNQPH